MDKIIVRGAREHNLKDIDVEIPRDKLVVITGLSGSGKSSLAFDTIYAEGQRRYVESLSTYARQFLEQKQKPDVDSIEGLSPAISIEQKSTSPNPRSTVGTLTEIYDYLRLLYARIGVPHCPRCGSVIQSQTLQNIVDTILEQPAQSRIWVLAPVVRGRKGEYRKELLQWRQEGFVRIRVNGTVYGLEDEIPLDKRKKHTLDLIIDRLVLKKGITPRLTDSVEWALRKADGLVKIQILDGPELTFSERFACDTCQVGYPEPTPRLFSFNSPYGACPTCDGLGQSLDLDKNKLIPDVHKSLAQGAVAAWVGRRSGFYLQQLSALADHYQQSMHTPWHKLPKAFQDIVLFGSDTVVIDFTYEGDSSQFHYQRAFEGVIPTLQRRLKEAEPGKIHEGLQAYLTRRPCPSCHGARLKPEALAVRIKGHSIQHLCALAVGDAQGFFNTLALSPHDHHVAGRILKEIRERLSFLESVGLDYLNLNRSSATLSGGEAQRIRLATQIGSALQGVIYVLDEPSIGLHQCDNARLLKTLQRLRDLGNTVLVVEHDEDTMRAADHIVDLGPGAGIQGGYITASGTPEAIQKIPASLTGDYLAGRRRIEVPTQRRAPKKAAIWVRGAQGHNLKNIDVAFPLGQLICVTGVSGSGKSTLVNDTLYVALSQALYGSHTPPAPHLHIEGTQYIDKVIDIDQSPIGRTPRSNPATYTQLLGMVRDMFAGLPESRARGYKPGRYSFNLKGGRCEACEGDGIIRIEMHFLPDVFVTCEACQGRRYNRETLEILYKGKSIADVLDMTVDEALAFLTVIEPIRKKLSTLQAVGLGYIPLGQSATTLSGGEAQRIKLARELSRRATGRTLYILDEPTTGLHFYDVERLLHVLHALVDAGNTVVVIEHHLDVIKTADHIIDLGPEGGFRGGQVVGTGTPEAISRLSESRTGTFLKPLL